MPNRRRLILASLAVALLAAPAAEARKPVVAYVDADNKLHLYDSEAAREVPAPALTIPDRIRGLGVSHDGRYVAYRDAGNLAHLYDRTAGTDTPLPDLQGTPRSVSNAGMVASDGNDNGPARLYDAIAKQPVLTGLDDAAGQNGHRMSKISGDGRFLATTCFAGCLVDSGGDSDPYVQDLGARADTAFPDDISGTANVDEEHPCISGDGRFAGADAPVGNQRDVFVHDRVAKQTLSLPGINDPNGNDVYCALDAGGEHIALHDADTGVARLYTRSGTRIPLPQGVSGPVWLIQPPGSARAQRLIARATAAPRAFRPVGRGRGRGTSLTVTLRRAARLQVFLRQAGGKRTLQTWSRRGRRGRNRLRIDGRSAHGTAGGLAALRPGAYVLRVTARAGRTRDSRTVAIRIRR